MDDLNAIRIVALLKFIVSKTHNIDIEEYPILYREILFITHHFWNSLLELDELEADPYRFSSTQSTWIIKIGLTYIDDYFNRQF